VNNPNQTLQQQISFNKHNDYNKTKGGFHLNPNIFLLEQNLPFYKDYSSRFVLVISSHQINPRKIKKDEEPHIEMPLNFFLPKDLQLSLEGNSHNFQPCL
jgi:hypothetical protein